MTLTLGSKLGPDEIESVLGTSGVGKVYRAWDRRLNRTIVSKDAAEVVLGRRGPAAALCIGSVRRSGPESSQTLFR